MAKRLTKKAVNAMFRDGRLATPKFAAYAPVAGMLDGRMVTDPQVLDNPGNRPEVSMGMVAFSGGKVANPSVSVKGNRPVNLDPEGWRNLAAFLGSPALPPEVEAIVRAAEAVREGKADPAPWPAA